jgi:hypothetical protein
MRQLELNLSPKVYCSRFSYAWDEATHVWKRKNGYTVCHVWHCHNTLGEWEYVVTRDQYEWYVMYQICVDNHGVEFLRVVDESDVIYATEDELSAKLSKLRRGRQ